MIPTEIWVLPRPRKNKYKGGFPLHFEKKVVEVTWLSRKSVASIWWSGRDR